MSAANPNVASSSPPSVARLVTQGLTDKEIARALGVSPTTVRTYIERMFEKLGIRRRSALARLAR